jgi:hypothetical protein
MASTRQGRKGGKMGREGFVQTVTVGEGGVPWRTDDDYTSPKDRERFRQQRPLLVKEFARLPAQERRNLEREFRRRLRDISVSDEGYHGYWDWHFKPLLEGTAPPKVNKSSPSPSPAPAPRGESPDSPKRRQQQDATKVILELVNWYPAQMTTKALVAALRGERTGVPADALDCVHFGAMMDATAEQVTGRVQKLVGRGWLRKGSGDRLTATPPTGGS